MAAAGVAAGVLPRALRSTPSDIDLSDLNVSSAGDLILSLSGKPLAMTLFWCRVGVGVALVVISIIAMANLVIIVVITVFLLSSSKLGDVIDCYDCNHTFFLLFVLVLLLLLL